MKYLLIVAALAAVSSAAVAPEDKGLISSVTTGISNAAAVAQSLSSATSTTQCVQKPMNLTALQNVLPPALASLVTEKNVETIKGVGTLAGLATSAATGNPVAIVKLLVFLMSPESPVDDLYNIGKEIVPHLSPSEIAAALPSTTTITNTFNTANGAILNGFHNIQDQVEQVFNKQPAAPAPAATAA